MLKRQLPATIAAALTIKGQGESFTLDLVYHNRPTDEYNAKIEEHKLPLGELILWLVESWDSEYPLTMEGLNEADTDRPGLLLAILYGFPRSRQVALEKN